MLFLPYVRYVHSLGKLASTIGPRGSAPFYFFSPNHTEVDIQRHFCPGPESNRCAAARQTPCAAGALAAEPTAALGVKVPPCCTCTLGTMPSSCAAFHLLGRGSKRPVKPDAEQRAWQRLSQCTLLGEGGAG